MSTRIDIEKQIDDETKETWTFLLFDFNAVFVNWKRETKQKGKRKWTIVKLWDKYDTRNSNTPEPILPENISNEVLSEVMKNVKVMTWNQWKGE